MIHPLVIIGSVVVRQVCQPKRLTANSLETAAVACEKDPSNDWCCGGKNEEVNKRKATSIRFVAVRCAMNLRYKQPETPWFNLTVSPP